MHGQGDTGREPTESGDIELLVRAGGTVSWRVGSLPPAVKILRLAEKPVFQLEARTATRILQLMSVIHDIETMMARLSPEQLAELEQLARGETSALDLPALDLGKILEPVGSRDQWYDEMLKGRV